MTRWLGLACGCVLVSAVVLSAQQKLPPSRNGGDGTKQAPQNGGANPQSEELKEARAQMQRDIEEGKRLQQQLKLDQKAKDRAAVQHDQEALKANREKVKQDQEHIQQILKGRGQGDGRGRGDGSGRGRAGGRGGRGGGR